MQNLSVEEIELDVIFDARTFCTCLYNKALRHDCHYFQERRQPLEREGEGGLRGKKREGREREERERERERERAGNR